MDISEQPTTVGDNLVVSLDYTLTVDGEVIDASKEGQPIQFIQGQGQIITGLERELYGMALGESKEVLVAAVDGYGEEDPSAFTDIPRSEIPANIPLEPGVKLQLKDQDGEAVQAYIDSVSENEVRLNFNHPLAGKDLFFTITVLGLRPPTPEELDHGHIHK
jgi:FKBP-type peptidyl-prolyl cis-trans isomerase SlyD